MKRISKKRIITAMVILPLILSYPIRSPVYADEDLPSTDLTVTFQVRGENIDGVGISFYRIASASISLDDKSVVYEVEEPYQSLITPQRLKRPEVDLQRYSERLSDLVEKQEPDYVAESDTEGEAVFSKVEPGAYLVKETARNGTALAYGKFEPYILRLPLKNENGTYAETAYARPKVPLTPATPPVETPPPKKTETADTSDHLHTNWYLGALIISLSVISMIITWKRKNLIENEEAQNQESPII